MEEQWTIARVLGWTTGFFEQKGLDSPRLDAELLVAHALRVERMRLYMDHHKPLLPEELGAIREGVRRRGQHEPVAYIIGERGFWKHDLQVDPRVLVPRPETERLVEIALEALAEQEAPRIADVGTGSGCIALSLAADKPAARVFAIDLSVEALAVAQANAARLEVANVEFMQGSVLEPAPGELDLVVSNPPYIPSADVERLMPDVARYEPRLALDGGADGMEVIRPLVAQAAEKLRPGGQLMMEIAFDQGPAVKALMESAGWVDVVVHQDYASLDRVVVGARP